LQAEARINNNLEVLQDAVRGTYDLLGVKALQSATA
jgi:hypothetical protein